MVLGHYLYPALLDRWVLLISQFLFSSLSLICNVMVFWQLFCFPHIPLSSLFTFCLYMIFSIVRDWLRLNAGTWFWWCHQLLWSHYIYRHITCLRFSDVVDNVSDPVLTVVFRIFRGALRIFEYLVVLDFLCGSRGFRSSLSLISTVSMGKSVDEKSRGSISGYSRWFEAFETLMDTTASDCGRSVDAR